MLYHQIISRAHTANMTYYIDTDLDFLTKVMLARFLHCKVTFSSLSTLYSWGKKKNHYTQPKMSEKLYSTSLRGKNLHKLPEFLLHRDLSIFPVYLFTQSLIYISKDSWIFTLYFKLPSNANLFIFSQIVLVFESSFCWFLCLFYPLTYPASLTMGFYLSFSFPPSLPPSVPLFLPFFFGTLHYFLAIQDPKDHLYFLSQS